MSLPKFHPDVPVSSRYGATSFGPGRGVVTPIVVDAEDTPERRAERAAQIEEMNKHFGLSISPDSEPNIRDRLDVASNTPIDSE